MCAPLLVRAQNLLTEALTELRKLMPMPLLGFDTDNRANEDIAGEPYEVIERPQGGKVDRYETGGYTFVSLVHGLPPPGAR